MDGIRGKDLTIFDNPLDTDFALWYNDLNFGAGAPPATFRGSPALHRKLTIQGSGMMIQEWICDRHWPIRPKQLTTGREKCVLCDGNTRQSICKCSFCGIATRDFIRAALLDLYEKHRKFPVVLIDNVYCQGIGCTEACKEAMKQAEMPINADRFVPFSGEAYSDYYAKKEPDDKAYAYYVYDLSDHYTCIDDAGYCFEKRNAPEFKANCTQSDLLACSEIMRFHNNGVAMPLKYRRCRAEGISGDFYAHTCERSGLIELAFPIIIDDYCVAVLIAGQITSDDWERCGGNVEKDGIVTNSVIKQNSEIGEAAGEVSNFIKRMQDRTGIRKTDFLYRYLADLTGAIMTEYRPSANEAIRKAFEMLKRDFEYENLRMVFSRFDGEKPYNEFAEPPVDEKREVSFKAIYDAMEKGDDEIIKLFDPDYTGRTQCYFRQNIVQIARCMLLTVVRWKINLSDEEQKLMKTFFYTLSALLFSRLMDELTSKLQREIEDREASRLVLTRSFAHDLNQKLEIIDIQTRLLEKKKEDWGLDRDNRAHMDLRDYIKNIRNLETILRLFSKDAAQANGAPLTSVSRRFEPYGTFLFNLREYYNANSKTRKFYMPGPSLVVSHSEAYPPMLADPALIERCVNNLLSNAFKYSFEYTNVYLDCYHKDGNYIIEVTNFSPPIRDDIRDRMFERGVSRANLRNYRNVKGEGYGLYIVREICHLHDGEVEALQSDIVSDYNVPMLRRIIREIRIAKDRGQTEEAMGRLGIERAQYDVYEAEYDRLTHTSASPGNRIASYYGIGNVLDEICSPMPQTKETLTGGRFIQMAIHTKTERVVFRMTLPQKGRS